jgi:hypothetical protein
MWLQRSKMKYDDPARQAVVDWYNRKFDANSTKEADWGEILAEAVHAYMTAPKEAPTYGHRCLVAGCGMKEGQDIPARAPCMQSVGIAYSGCLQQMLGGMK